jgi:hypothetical protein
VLDFSFFSFLSESCRKGFIDDHENEPHIANFHSDVKEGEDVVIERQPLRTGEHLLDEKVRLFCLQKYMIHISWKISHEKAQTHHKIKDFSCFKLKKYPLL